MLFIVKWFAFEGGNGTARDEGFEVCDVFGGVAVDEVCSVLGCKMGFQVG